MVIFLLYILYILSVGLSSAASIRARQIRFIDINPSHPAAPVSMHGRFSRRNIVEGAGRHDRSGTIARGMRHWAIAAAADLPGEAFGFG
jgi:hypothetical protein